MKKMKMTLLIIMNSDKISTVLLCDKPNFLSYGQKWARLWFGNYEKRYPAFLKSSSFSKELLNSLMNFFRLHVFVIQFFFIDYPAWIRDLFLVFMGLKIIDYVFRIISVFWIIGTTGQGGIRCHNSAWLYFCQEDHHFVRSKIEKKETLTIFQKKCPVNSTAAIWKRSFIKTWPSNRPEFRQKFPILIHAVSLSPRR